MTRIERIQASAEALAQKYPADAFAQNIVKYAYTLGALDEGEKMRDIAYNWVKSLRGGLHPDGIQAYADQLMKKMNV